MALVLSQRNVGSYESILRMRVDRVLAAWDFVQFQGQYQETLAIEAREARERSAAK